MAQLPSTLDRVRQRMPFVKVLAGPGNIHRIPELVKEARQVTVRAREQSGTCMEDRPRRGLLTAVSPGRTAANRDESTQILPEGLPRSNIPGVTAYVTIMYGCDNFCSYCIVPYVRGPQISRLPGDVLREVRGLVDRGYKEITLLGQNVNAFGLDRKYLAQPAPNEAGTTYDFASLLRRSTPLPDWNASVTSRLTLAISPRKWWTPPASATRCASISTCRFSQAQTASSG